jgi:hypothetical protein
VNFNATCLGAVDPVFAMLCKVKTTRHDNVNMSTDTPRPVPPLPAIALGLYQHYKGPHYKVLGVVRHSETLEALVLYHPIEGDQALWVRPWEMFTGQIEVDGVLMQRFRHLG